MCKFYVGTLNWSVYDVLFNLSDIFSESTRKYAPKRKKKKKRQRHEQGIFHPSHSATQKKQPKHITAHDTCLLLEVFTEKSANYCQSKTDNWGCLWFMALFFESSKKSQN